MRVSLVTADLVDGALREADHVEWVERDLGVGDRVADRFLIAAGHVDRDGADRLRALRAELVEEGLQGGGRERTTRSRRRGGRLPR